VVEEPAAFVHAICRRKTLNIYSVSIRESEYIIDLYRSFLKSIYSMIYSNRAQQSQLRC
jgi:hypothetical protein